MAVSDHKRWLRSVILFGTIYLVVGVTFGAFAGWSTSKQMGIMWRRAAWLVSAVAFVVHIGHEQFRVRNSPSSTALHASLAAALGAFGLAVAANVHALREVSGNQRLLALALVLWPIITVVPAFVVALALAVGMTKIRRKG